MDESLKNKVAFIGGFFDNGSYVMETINHIVNLKKEFEDRLDWMNSNHTS